MLLLGIRVGVGSTLLIGLLFNLGTLHAQMSPGELSHSHQALEGALKCASCHSFGTGGAHLKCLDCHVEIRRRLEQKAGYHAQIIRGTGNAASSDCARCHAEHNGRAFELVRWRVPKAKFDHRQAGFMLQGRHAGLSCQQCHQPKHILTPPGRN